MPELVCASHYSFLRGASPPGDLIRAALQLGYSGLGLCDRNSVAGVVRALSALEDIARSGRRTRASRAKFQLAGRRAAGLCRRRAGHRRLSLQSGRVGAAVPPAHARQEAGEKGRLSFELDDLLADAGDLLLILLPTQNIAALEKSLAAPARRLCRNSGSAPICRAAAATAAVFRSCGFWRRRRASDCWRRMMRFTPSRKIAPCRTCSPACASG